jgi:hypothetical protein
MPAAQFGKAPFETWPVQRAGDGVLVWRHSPGVLVTQSSESCATPAAMEAVSKGVDLLVEHDLCAERGGLLLFHDWRTFQRYDSAARQHLLARMRARPKGYVRRTIVVVPPTAFWRMAIAGANVIYGFLHVSAPEVETDVVKAKASAALRSVPDPPPEWFR